MVMDTEGMDISHRSGAASLPFIAGMLLVFQSKMVKFSGCTI